jgi:hypothetical protein
MKEKKGKKGGKKEGCSYNIVVWNNIEKNIKYLCQESCHKSNENILYWDVMCAAKLHG